jgi:hypothetical protein
MAVSLSIRHSREAAERYAFRQKALGQIVDLDVALEKGVGRIDLSHRSMQLLALVRLRPRFLTGSESNAFSELDRTFDAVFYFWDRCRENPTCVSATDVDRNWLRATCLETNKRVWEAFDFREQVAALEASETAKTRVVREATARGPWDNMVDAKLKLSSLEAKERLLEYQTKHIDEILGKAGQEKTHFDPAFALHALFIPVRNNLKSLQASLAGP